MNRIKVIKDKNFTTINNEFIFNKDLSLKAKGLLCHLLALPDNWKLYVEEITNWHKDGKSAIYSAFKELNKHNYIERVVERENGKIVRHVYVVYEKPKQHIEKLHVEKLNVEKSNVDNTALLNTNNTKDLIKLNTNNNFIIDVLAISEELGFKEHAEFIDYWTEKSPNAKKSRWQKQSSFDIKRRIQRWIKNSKNNKPSKVESTLTNWAEARKKINQ